MRCIAIGSIALAIACGSDPSSPPDAGSDATVGECLSSPLRFEVTVEGLPTRPACTDPICGTGLFRIRAEGATEPLALDGQTPCLPVCAGGVGMISCIGAPCMPTPVGTEPIIYYWDGAHYEVAGSCAARSCAPAGRYTATVCVTEEDCTTLRCTDVPFDLGDTSPIAVTLTND